jgi:hypothetical protein
MARVPHFSKIGLKIRDYFLKFDWKPRFWMFFKKFEISEATK